MRSTIVRRALALGLLIAAASSANAEPWPIEHQILPHTLSSGPIENRAATAVVVLNELIDAGNVPWLRLTFHEASLPEGSFLRITSLLDGATQNLDATDLWRWRNTSAYFNGPMVRLQLIAAAGSQGNAVEVGDLIAGVWQRPDRTQCGPTDDRIPSDRPERARLLNIGCTASIYTTDSCFITAGHCVSGGGADTVEFNVPPSMPNGNIVHPGPEDQYPVLPGIEFVNGGIGNDWGLFQVDRNSETGLLPFEAQGARMILAAGLPGGLPTPIEIVGYGVDDGAANQTQQVSTGPLNGISGTSLQYAADTQGGNSGSSVVWLDSGEVIGIHTHGGCSFGGGNNNGTALTNGGLQNALADFCPEDAALACSDFQKIQGGCRPDGNVGVRIGLFDEKNDGDSIIMRVDGEEKILTVRGRVASFIEGPFAGDVVVEMTQPACGAPVTLQCP